LSFGGIGGRLSSQFEANLFPRRNKETILQCGGVEKFFLQIISRIRGKVIDTLKTLAFKFIS
jgi:hypothetical protein